MRNPIAQRIAYIVMPLYLTFLTACASGPTQLSTITLPPPTDKLRIYFQPYTAPYELRGGWSVTEAQFELEQLGYIKQNLSKIGTYEIVNKIDVQAALGNRKPSRYQMERNKGSLAREIGKALHADYVIVTERGTKGITNTVYFVIVMINVATGERYEAEDSVDAAQAGAKTGPARKRSFGDIFQKAKQDLIATVIAKRSRINEADALHLAQSKSPGATPPQISTKTSEKPAPLVEQNKIEQQPTMNKINSFSRHKKRHQDNYNIKTTCCGKSDGKKRDSRHYDKRERGKHRQGWQFQHGIVP